MLNFAASSKTEVVNIFPIALHVHRHFPYHRADVKQNGFCIHIIHWKCVFIYLFTITDVYFYCTFLVTASSG